MKRFIFLIAISALCSLAFKSAADLRAIPISIIQDPAAGAPVRHGVEGLKAALHARNIRYEEVSNLQAAQGQLVIVAGLPTDGGPAADRLKALGITVPSTSGSLVIHWAEWQGKSLLLLSGSDDRGLMYGLLEVADRIGWASNVAKPLSEVHDTVESPSVADRGETVLIGSRCYSPMRWMDTCVPPIPIS
jgi:hypothetical protein